MKTSFYLFAVLATLGFHQVLAQTIESTFVAEGFGGSLQGNWDSPQGWSPAIVPNNDGEDIFNVTVGDPESSNRAFLNLLGVDPTVENLSGFMTLISESRSFTVNENTSLGSGGSNVSRLVLRATQNDARFDLGNLAEFTEGTLYGDYQLTTEGGYLSVLQFDGADVRRLIGQVSLRGEGASIVDENGVHGLRSLEVVQGSLSLSTGASLNVLGSLGCVL